MTPELAAHTWSGEHVKAMVSRGHGGGPDRTLWEGVLYDARHNAEGLHLVEGSACELHRGRPAAVEVWLGGPRSADASTAEVDRGWGGEEAADQGVGWK